MPSMYHCNQSSYDGQYIKTDECNIWKRWNVIVIDLYENVLPKAIVRHWTSISNISKMIFYHLCDKSKFMPKWLTWKTNSRNSFKMFRKCVELRTL